MVSTPPTRETHGSVAADPDAPNVAIMTPVCLAMFTGRGRGPVCQGAVSASRGLERRVGSLWRSILAAAAAGLLFPGIFAQLLAMQVLYKLAWLLAFVVPAAVARDRLPAGIVACSAAIVRTWPVFLWLAFVTCKGGSRPPATLFVIGFSQCVLRSRSEMSVVHTRAAAVRAQLSMSREDLADLVCVDPQSTGYPERGDYALLVEFALELAAVFKVPGAVLFSLKPFVPLGRNLKEQGS